MQAKVKKKMRAQLTKSQKGLLKNSLKELLGKGLIATPQRSQHVIHPFLLKDALNSRILNN